MVRLSLCLLVISLVSLAHGDLFSGFASARPASNATYALLISDATGWVYAILYASRTKAQSFLCSSTLFFSTHSLIIFFFPSILLFLISSVTATSKPAAKANLNLCWLSYEAPFHIYNLEYVHNVYLTVNTTYQGILVYYARGVRKHCHDDGVWCVKHGGPQSPEMTIWYKGLEYQHGNWTVDCGEHCKMYYDDVKVWRAGGERVGGMLWMDEDWRERYLSEGESLFLVCSIGAQFPSGFN